MADLRIWGASEDGGVARLIGDVDLGEVDRWCRAHLGSHRANELFREGYQSAVLGLRWHPGSPSASRFAGQRRG